jgi:hypothetical protein
MHPDSVFRKPLESNNTNKHRGFDYKGKILKKTMSSKMFTSNELLHDYLVKLDNIIYNGFENIKTIRGFYGISRDKNDKRFN